MTADLCDRGELALPRTLWAAFALLCACVIAAQAWACFADWRYSQREIETRFHENEWAHRQTVLLQPILGSVEGLNRDAVSRLLAAKLGPDQPKPIPPGAIQVAYPMVEEKDPDLIWHIPRNNWRIHVGFLDGKAFRADVFPMNQQPLGPRPPDLTEIRMMTLVYAGSVMILLLALLLTSRIFRRRGRWPAELALMAAVFMLVMALSSPWFLPSKLDWIGPWFLRGRWTDGPWPYALLAVLIAGAAVRWSHSPLRGATSPNCPRCDYNLNGNISGTCPECGTRILPNRGP